MRTSRCVRAARQKFGTRAEIKNLNSFRFVEKAIQYEVARQIELIEGGGKVVQETRLYDSDKNETRSMRSKEEANDYRYFPDPDLLPVEIEEAFIDAVRESLPELPDEKAARFAREFGLSAYDAGVLSASREMGGYFEAVVGGARRRPHAKLAANWVMGELSSALNRDNVEIAAIACLARGVGRPAGAHRRCDHLRQDRQGSVRVDVVRRQIGGCDHRGEGAAADHRFERHRRA